MRTSAVLTRSQNSHRTMWVANNSKVQTFFKPSTRPAIPTLPPQKVDRPCTAPRAGGLLVFRRRPGAGRRTAACVSAEALVIPAERSC